MYNSTENPFEMTFSNRGRLSSKETQRMEYCLQAYYDAMIGIIQTSKKTGIHPRTVSKYFKIFEDKIRKSYDSTFLELCKSTKNQRIEALDADIIKCKESENVIAQKISALSQNNVKEFVLLQELLNKKNKSRQKLQDQKIELINTATFEIDIDSEIKKIQQPPEESYFTVIPKDMISEIDNSFDMLNDSYYNVNCKKEFHNPQNNLSETVICILNNSSNTTSDIKNYINDNTNNYLDDCTHNYTGRKLVP